MRNHISATIGAISASLLLVGSASAAVNLVTNGSFEANTFGTGQLGFNTDLTGWTYASYKKNYDFLFGPGGGISNTDADKPGATGSKGNVSLWGPDNPGKTHPANGLTLSPDGGYFLAIDPSYRNTGPISQTLHGLKIGQTYTLNFDYAAAQQFHFNGITSEGWDVTFGSTTHSTPTLINSNHGFTGWKQSKMKFVATSTTQKLSFLATGGPKSTLPPFALLDGVSLTGVPEPTSWALMILGFGGIGAVVRNRRREAVTAA